MGVKAAGKFRCKLLCSCGACQRHAWIRLPKERSIGSAAGWFRCPLPKEGTAAPAAMARARRVSCLRDAPPVPVGTWARSPHTVPAAFLGTASGSRHSPGSATHWLHGPGEVTRLPCASVLPRAANHPKIGGGKVRCANSARRRRPHCRDALGGVTDSVVPVFLQDGVTARFGGAVARTASIPAPKRVHGCKRGWRIAPGTVGHRGVRSLSFSPVTLIC